MTAPGDFIENLTDDPTSNFGLFDSNPAHVIYELLVDTDFGMGAATTSIDTVSFVSAAETLCSENFGLSFLWTQQLEIQKLVNEILDHIEATLFVSPLTGLLTLKLIRGDYSISGLPQFTPDNSNVTNFSRKLWGETVNEIQVTYTDPDNEEEKVVVAQDLGNIEMQGGIVSDSRNYYGVHDKDLAVRLAQRDLRSAATPLASCDIEIDRTAWALLPGDVCELQSPDDQINSLIMRVGPVDYGKPGDPTIRTSLVEDVFALGTSDYTVPDDTIEPPVEQPTAADFDLILTLPYFIVINSADPSLFDGAEYPEVLAAVLAGEVGSDTAEFELLGNTVDAGGNPIFGNLGTKTIARHALLPSDLVPEVTTVIAAFDEQTLNGFGPVVGGFVMIEGVEPTGGSHETTSELCLVKGLATGGEYILERGVLDTVPREWSAGTACWFLDAGMSIIDPRRRADTELVDYKILPRTSQGLLTEARAPLISNNLTGRPWLPSRPANVKVNAVAFGVVEAEGVDPIPTTWSRRNRTTEDSVVLSWDDGDVAPEGGQVTVVYLTDLAGSILHTYADNSGVSQNVDPADFGSETEGFIVFKSSFSGTGALESLQEFKVEVRLLIQGSASPTIAVGLSGNATIV
ncbi:MAG: phage tail protein [Alphaproteobacteria bacterium]|nr:phage tail protein [Alphaproteobacteria bacterium]